MSYNCPENLNPQNFQGQNSNQKNNRTPNTGKVNHVSAVTVVEEPKVMIGTFDVHSTPATILFYSRTSHTFVSQAFIRTHNILACAMKSPITVNSPKGTILASHCCFPINLTLRGGRL